MNKIAFHNLILTKYFPKVKNKGSSFVSPALGWAGQGRLNINNNLLPKKIWAKPKRTGEKEEGGLGEGIFARSLSVPKSRRGREAARPCVSKEAKSAKIVSLFEKFFVAAILKVSIFADFVRRQAASRWAGLPPEGRQSVGVLPKMSSNFFQQTPPKTISRLARGFAPRFGG